MQGCVVRGVMTNQSPGISSAHFYKTKNHSTRHNRDLMGVLNEKRCKNKTSEKYFSKIDFEGFAKKLIIFQNFWKIDPFSIEVRGESLKSNLKRRGFHSLFRGRCSLLL